MKFTKMHGLGNDYIYMYVDKDSDMDFSSLSKILSRRHFGIGADGIITISPSDKCDYFMQIYNADGSKGEMCGNGIRCVGKYVYDNGLTDKTELTIDTLAGEKKLKLNIVDNKVSSVKVDMGEPKIHDGSKITDIKDVTHILEVNGKEYEVMDISMGNPHTVIFVDELSDELVRGVGPLIEKSSYYPNRTNVEFIKVLNDNTLEMRVWERGSGETMACGTGACASFYAYYLKSNMSKCIIKLLGGNLDIELDSNGHIIMDGPATKVFDGEFSLNDIIN